MSRLETSIHGVSSFSVPSSQFPVDGGRDLAAFEGFEEIRAVAGLTSYSFETGAWTKGLVVG